MVPFAGGRLNTHLASWPGITENRTFLLSKINDDMSRAFVKEDDAEEAPMIPPRANLPAGVPNYVTPQGMEQLKEEKRELEDKQGLLRQENKDSDQRREMRIVEGKLQALQQRIDSARIITKPPDNQRDTVRFGARVEVMHQDKRKATYHLVGVDEADVKVGKIGFIAPLARALMGKKIGEICRWQRGELTEEIEIKAITWPQNS